MQLTVIGCADLDSCIVNNVDTVSGKQRKGLCTQKVKKKKKKKSIICNDFQQAGDLPPVFNLNDGAPNSVGFIGYNDNTPTPFSNKSWTAFSEVIDCYSDTNQCADPNDKGKFKDARFPYFSKTAPASLSAAKALLNSNLVPGCYFNNTNGDSKASGANSTAINCLANELKIKDTSKKGSQNLIIYTKSSATGTNLLPVNIFIDSTAVSFTAGGIENIDTSINNWYSLRIIGHNQAARNSSDTTQPILCDQQTITSTKNDDINGAWIWLPNGSLIYDKVDSKDTSYVVIWACKFYAPSKKNSNYTIITPKNLDAIIRSNLVSTLPGFSTASGSSFRGYGSEDTTP